jgi:hypothetical protein
MSFVLPALAIGLGSIRIRPQRGFYPTIGADGPSQPLVAHATLEELHRDDLEITEHPVELGAPIADHSFSRPAEVVIRCAWSNGPASSPSLLGAAVGIAGAKFPAVGQIVGAVKTASAAVSTAQSILSGNAPSQAKAIYGQLLELQQSRIPFVVYTGKRIYRNMLFKSLGVTTDGEHENCLLVTAICKQIIIVSTSTVTVPVNSSAQGSPEKTSPLMKYGQKSLKSLPTIPSGIPSLSLPAGLGVL